MDTMKNAVLRCIAWVLFLGGVSLVPSVCGAVTLNFATAYGADNFQTRNLQVYADELEKATSGKVVLKVHPAGSLLKPAQIFAGVRDGEAEGGEVIMSSLARLDPMFGMDALPFIVSGYADARRMWKISRPLIEKAMKKQGLVLLYAVPWPPQNLYSRVPIESFESFKGMRMRTYNPATDRIAQLVHAKPMKIEVVNLQKAIADGELDMMITSSWTGVEVQAWSALRYYYRVSAWIPKNMVFVRQKVFDALDNESRQQMMRLAQEAEDRGWRMSQNSDEGYESQLAAHKVNVATMEFFNREYLDRIGETLAREWLKRAGPEELKVLLQYTTNRSVEQAAK